MKVSRVAILPLIITLIFSGGFAILGAQANEIDEIGSSIEEKSAEIDGVLKKIDQYQERIESYEGSQQTLANEIAILENRAKKTELDIQRTELEVDKVELEIEKTDAEIILAEEELIRAKNMIRIVLNEMYVFDDAGTLEVMFGNYVFSEFFDQIQYLETLQKDIGTQVASVKLLQTQLDDQKEQQVGRKNRLVDLRESLQTTKRNLESEQRAKDNLLAQAENSEANFRVLMRELREEQQYIQGQIFKLQEALQNKIDDGGEDAVIFEGPTVLSWPVEGPIITSTFHDPTYPFRHLFEHSGLDMAIPQGSTVRAAAPGYVAWARTGRSYGNYIMLVHANGVATLYAHLSRMDVVADQFVQRGQPIGKSGGASGSPGAGLSTGPHLHFEVRVDGIPNNPYNYLVN
jgi:murein DD-endopeptidase MepM/ murein hydrolase activator NlpD